MADVMNAITARASIRAYKETELPENIIKTLVEAGLKAPTARNEQELHFSVVKCTNPILDEISKDLNESGVPIPSWYYKAPVVIFISGDDNFKWSALDAGIACENIHLAATDMGIGSIVLGIIDGVMHGPNAAKYNNALEIPEGYSFKIAVAAGYSATTKEPHAYDEAKSVSYIK